MTREEVRTLRVRAARLTGDTAERYGVFVLLDEVDRLMAALDAHHDGIVVANEKCRFCGTVPFPDQIPGGRKGQ